MIFILDEPPPPVNASATRKGWIRMLSERYEEEEVWLDSPPGGASRSIQRLTNRSVEINNTQHAMSSDAS